MREDVGGRNSLRMFPENTTSKVKYLGNVSALMLTNKHA